MEGFYSLLEVPLPNFLAPNHCFFQVCPGLKTIELKRESVYVSKETQFKTTQKATAGKQIVLGLARTGLIFTRIQEGAQPGGGG